MIWLLRHGQAAEGSPDPERPLTGKGRQQARRAGVALAALGVQLDACLTSPKLRAADTARLACEQLGGMKPRLESRLAGGPFDPVALSAGLGEAVLLVGHEPDFSNALREMTGAQARLPKGAIAGVEAGELRVLLRPKELRAIAEAAPARPE